MCNASQANLMCYVELFIFVDKKKALYARTCKTHTDVFIGVSMQFEYMNNKTI